MADEDVATTTNGPLSWRDVYKAVEGSEERILDRFDKFDLSVSKTLLRHDELLMVIADRHLRLDAQKEERENLITTSKTFIISVVAIVNGIVATVLAIATGAIKT